MEFKKVMMVKVWMKRKEMMIKKKVNPLVKIDYDEG
jgi:hypothetical protein